MIGPERLNEYHACQGNTVYIPWPFSIISKKDSDSPKMEVRFQERNSERSQLIATFDERQKLRVGTHKYRHR